MHVHVHVPITHNSFEETEEEVRVELHEQMGHPLPCSSGMCDSKLRIISSAAVHYPLVCELLHLIYAVKRKHMLILDIKRDLPTE